jgi:hypothetical protein
MRPTAMTASDVLNERYFSKHTLVFVPALLDYPPIMTSCNREKRTNRVIVIPAQHSDYA